jgi:hypothetical protein
MRIERQRVRDFPVQEFLGFGLRSNRLQLQKSPKHANEPTDDRFGHAFASIASRFVLEKAQPGDQMPEGGCVGNGIGVGMVRFFLFLIAAIAAASSVGYAQEGRTAGHRGTAEQQRACRPDAIRLCRGLHEDEAIYTCLKTNVAKLRSVCREVIEGNR